MRRGQKPKTPTKLSRLVTQMVEEHGGPASGFAQLADLTPAQLSRVMSPGAADRPPGVLSCLKLARASGYAPSVILISAGHAKFARVLEDIIENHRKHDVGAEHDTRGLVTAEELEVVRALRTLTINTRHAVIFLINRAAEMREPADSPNQPIAQKVAAGG